MRTIILLCTVHNDNGKCNSLELYKIIESINPDVIFEEITPARFDAYYKEIKFRTLETFTIRNYLQRYKIEHIPVDNFDHSDMIPKKDVCFMFDKIYDSNAEYLDLDKKRFYKAQEFGIPFINSTECDDMFERQNTIAEDVIKKINDDELTNIYKKWKDFNDKRDNEMINNICNYSSQHEYKRAIFLIGAGHRLSIVNKVKDRKGEQDLIWEFYSFHE